MIVIPTLLLALPLSVTERAGTVAVLAQPFELEAQVAHRLCPAPEARVVIRMGAAEGATLDVLANLQTPVTDLELDPAAPRMGDDPALAARVERARCVVLEGGEWFAWWHALRPYGRRSALGEALVRAHERGATVIGVGASGAHLVEHALLARGTLQRPSRDPHDPSLDVLVGGLALARGAVIDFATDGRTSPERLLDVALDAHADLAVWLAGPCAWIQEEDPRSVTIAAHGGATWLFDLSGVRRSRECVEGVDLVRLTDGARVDLAQRIVEEPRRARTSPAVGAALPATVRELFALAPEEVETVFERLTGLSGDAERWWLAPPATTDPLRGLQLRSPALRARLSLARGVR